MAHGDTRLAYQGKIEAYLKEWGTFIDEWQNSPAASQFIDELNSKRQVVRRKLAEIKDASDDQWQSQQHDMDQAVKDMKQALDAARERSGQR